MAQLSGLLRTALTDPDLRTITDAARDLRPRDVPALAVEGPAALRPFLAGLLSAPDGAGRPVLVVTATDREAEDLGVAAAELIGTDEVFGLAVGGGHDENGPPGAVGGAE